MEATKIQVQKEAEKIELHFKKCLILLRKKEFDDFNLEWGLWSFGYIKWLREQVIKTNYVFMKYLYAYWHNRNSVLFLHSVTRIGKIKEKKKLEFSGKLYLDLIFERRTTADPQGVVKQVDDYLWKLRHGGENEPIATVTTKRKKAEVESAPPDEKKEDNPAV